MQVKIINSSEPTYWYSKLIGEEFKVINWDEMDYKVFGDNLSYKDEKSICCLGRLILKTDCEIIVEPQIPLR